MGMRKFLQDQGLITDEPSPTVVVTKPVVLPTYQNLMSATPMTTPTTVAVDARALSVIQAKVDKSTVPGYPDFVAMNTDLASDIADPTVRARTALKSVARMRNITPQAVLDSVNDRIALLTAAAVHLQESLDSMLKDQLGEKDAAIVSYRTDLAALEAKIADLHQKESTALVECTTLNNDLRAKQALLTHAADTLGAQLIHDRDIISHNLTW